MCTFNTYGTHNICIQIFKTFPDYMDVVFPFLFLLLFIIGNMIDVGLPVHTYMYIYNIIMNLYKCKGAYLSIIQYKNGTNNNNFLRFNPLFFIF